MCELSDIEAAMRALSEQLAKDADELKMAVSKFVDETGKKKGNSAVFSSQSSQSTNTPSSGKKLTMKESHRLLGFPIPFCYGTIELRETLARAGRMLSEGINQLNQAESKIPNQYVQIEMIRLRNNFYVLKEAFDRMWQQMEMNCDDLVVDSSAPPSAEDLIRQKSPA